jgi:hypothetical protein
MISTTFRYFGCNIAHGIVPYVRTINQHERVDLLGCLATSCSPSGWFVASRDLNRHSTLSQFWFDCFFDLLGLDGER